MSGLQEVSNQAGHQSRRILSEDEEDAFRDWLDRAQLSIDDARWIVALLKHKFREGRREGRSEVQQKLDEAKAATADTQRQYDQLQNEAQDRAVRIRELQSSRDLLEGEAQYWYDEWLADEDRCAALRRQRGRLAARFVAQLGQKDAAIRALEQQLRDRTEDLRHEREAREALEHDGRGEIDEQGARIDELRNQVTQLKACVHVQRFLRIPTRAADTEYPQDPDTIIANVTKSGVIALFRKYMIGKRRIHDEADGFAGRNVAEFLDLLGVEEGPHAEAIALLSPVEVGVFRERDVRVEKRRRIE